METDNIAVASHKRHGVSNNQHPTVYLAACSAWQQRKYQHLYMVNISWDILYMHSIVDSYGKEDW